MNYESLVESIWGNFFDREKWKVYWWLPIHDFFKGFRNIDDFKLVKLVFFVKNLGVDDKFLKIDRSYSVKKKAISLLFYIINFKFHNLFNGEAYNMKLIIFFHKFYILIFNFLRGLSFLQFEIALSNLSICLIYSPYLEIKSNVLYFSTFNLLFHFLVNTSVTWLNIIL